MRMGRVMFRLSYAVDLDNSEMVDQAKDALREDVDQIAGHNDVWACIGEEEDCTLSESDIPEFILEAMDPEPDTCLIDHHNEQRKVSHGRTLQDPTPKPRG